VCACVFVSACLWVCVCVRECVCETLCDMRMRVHLWAGAEGAIVWRVIFLRLCGCCCCTCVNFDVQ